MPRFEHDKVEIAFLDEGQGEPIILVHGFASNAQINWVQPGWVATLTRAGRRVIALDNRGHGASSKLYDPAAYHSARMADDILALLDHLALGAADRWGTPWERGLLLSSHFCMRTDCAGQSWVGWAFIWCRRPSLPNGIAEALEAPSVAEIHDRTGRMFRAFAEQTKSDLKALAACAAVPAESGAWQLANVRAPVLVAVGTKDTIAGSPHELASLLPHGRAFDISNRDHMLAVGDKSFKQAVLDFIRAS